MRAEARLQEIRGQAVVLSNGQPAISIFGVPLIASCRKSFLSALPRIAVRDQKINLDIGFEEVDDYSKLTEIERRATVRQLLQAKSGVYIPVR